MSLSRTRLVPRLVPSAAIAFALVPLTVACGGGAAAKAVQPRPPTAKEAIDPGKPACDSPADPDQPLVVDMPPEDRTDLEVAMRGKVAVVAYDCKSLKVLRDCHVDGDYAFFGTTLQEKTVRLTSSDEISVNLPLTGAGLIAKIGGQLKGGASLDLAMLMVGARRTTWNSVRRADLKGSCANASHCWRARESAENGAARPRVTERPG